MKHVTGLFAPVRDCTVEVGLKPLNRDLEYGVLLEWGLFCLGKMFAQFIPSVLGSKSVVGAGCSVKNLMLGLIHPPIEQGPQ